MRYILFVKETCPFCIKARDMLSERKIPFKEVVFQEDQLGMLEEIKDAYSWRTVPMIFYRDENKVEFVGGYTDLVEYVDSNVQEK